jgi:hypothetical protein
MTKKLKNTETEAALPSAAILAAFGVVEVEGPTEKIDTLLAAAGRAIPTYQAHRARFLALPGFDAASCDALPALTSELAGAEKAWRLCRQAKTETDRTSLRKEAEALRAAVLAGGRFLFRRPADAAHLAKVNYIAEGDDLPDLIQDMTDCAELVDAHPELGPLLASALKGTANVAARARELHDQLLTRSEPVDADAKKRARDQAAKALVLVLAELRAAAQFVFRDEPTNLRDFRHPTTVAKSRKPKTPA